MGMVFTEIETKVTRVMEEEEISIRTKTVFKIIGKEEIGTIATHSTKISIINPQRHMIPLICSLLVIMQQKEALTRNRIKGSSTGIRIKGIIKTDRTSLGKVTDFRWVEARILETVLVNEIIRWTAVMAGNITTKMAETIHEASTASKIEGSSTTGLRIGVSRITNRPATNFKISQDPGTSETIETITTITTIVVDLSNPKTSPLLNRSLSSPTFLSKFPKIMLLFIKTLCH